MDNINNMEKQAVKRATKTTTAAQSAARSAAPQAAPAKGAPAPRAAQKPAPRRREIEEEEVYSDEDYDSDESEYSTDSEYDDPIEYLEARRQFALENTLGFNVNDNVIVRKEDETEGTKGVVMKILHRPTATPSGWLVGVKLSNGKSDYFDSDDCYPDF